MRSTIYLLSNGLCKLVFVVHIDISFLCSSLFVVCDYCLLEYISFVCFAFKYYIVFLLYKIWSLFFILFYFILWIIYISFHYYISSDIWTVCSSVRLSEFLLSSLKLYASLVIDKSVLSGPLPLNITWLVAVTNTFGVATMNGIDPKEWH